MCACGVQTSNVADVCVQNVLHVLEQKLKDVDTNAWSLSLGGLRSNAHGLSMARWKAHCRLPISDN